MSIPCLARVENTTDPEADVLSDAVEIRAEFEPVRRDLKTILENQEKLLKDLRTLKAEVS